MVGLRPIVEFMTWNFSLVAYDQIVNNAAKCTPCRAAISTSRLYSGAPRSSARARRHTLTVSRVNLRSYSRTQGRHALDIKDAKGLLKTSIRDDNPIIFIESEVMYGDKGEIPDGEYTIPLGVGEVKKTGSDVTIVSWSKTLAHVVFKASGRNSGRAEHQH